jgi:hypothetical protein
MLEILRPIAAEADSQIEYLRKIGGEPYLYVSVDDLALDWHEIVLQLNQHLEDAGISPQAADCMRSLNNYFSWMTELKRPELWDYEALSTAEEWRSARKCARRCLELLGEANSSDEPVK